jgi:hypothetical protein
VTFSRSPSFSAFGPSCGSSSWHSLPTRFVSNFLIHPPSGFFGRTAYVPRHPRLIFHAGKSSILRRSFTCGNVFTRLLKVEVCFPDMRVARHWKFDVFVFFFCSPCTFFVARPLWSRFAFQIIYVSVTYYFDELAFRHIHGNSNSRISPYTSRVRAFVLVLLWQLCRSGQTQ